MEQQVTEELLALERAGWDALCAATGADFYGGVMADDGLMVLADGSVLDRPTVVAALGQSPPWHRYELTDVRVVAAGDGAAALVYTGRAWRDADGDPFTGAMTSLYVRVGGRWRLALYTQTPVP
ncbi:nuclear transport factor 2 family protein [Geodermatophilus telluris]|uniref:nuclear transport factor 2 family protein n=1 Tax=Geodermatophilus telluris TaxID=1190417 RepID=UPI001C31AB71|nr:nuclear transport factor 2 family protein [Geodermatophilus telluris]